jgi:hypothetical protein
MQTTFFVRMMQINYIEFQRTLCTLRAQIPFLDLEFHVVCLYGACKIRINSTDITYHSQNRS